MHHHTRDAFYMHGAAMQYSMRTSTSEIAFSSPSSRSPLAFGDDISFVLTNPTGTSVCLFSRRTSKKGNVNNKNRAHVEVRQYPQRSRQHACCTQHGSFAYGSMDAAAHTRTVCLQHTVHCSVSRALDVPAF